jgi:hypothetical protein
MPFGVRQSSAAQTNINRARARDSGLCTAAQPVAFCSLAASISLSLIHRSCCAANDILSGNSFRHHAGPQRYLDSSNHRSSRRDSEGEVTFEPDSCADLCHGDKRANLAHTSPEAEGKDYEIILDRIPSSPAATTQHGPKDNASNVQSSLQKIISTKPLLGSAMARLPPAEERLLEGQIDKVRRTVLYLWDRDWHHRGAHFCHSGQCDHCDAARRAAVGELFHYEGVFTVNICY